MPFSAGPFEIRSAVATIPRFGAWSVRAGLVGDKLPAQGSRISVVLGNLTLSGTVRRAEEYVGRSEVLIVAGADGWRTSVKRRAYRSGNGFGEPGVKLAIVAADLARDVGEQLGPLGDLEKVKLSYAWVRPEGSAAAALDEMGYPWWVGIDGVTMLGARPVEGIVGARIGVESYQPSLRRAALTSPEDELSLFLPGVLLAGEGLPAVSILSTRIRVSDRKAIAEVEIA